MRTLALVAFALVSSVLLVVGLFGILNSGGSSSYVEPTYSAPAAGRIAFVSDRDGNTEIYTMAADGSGQTNLTHEARADTDPSWSPNGRRIAFRSFRAVHSDIFIMNADGSDVSQLTQDDALDGQPRWSPDGARIAYYSFADRTQGLLWVADVSGRSRAALLAASVNQEDCAGGFPGGWFPDGRHVLFRGGTSNSLQVCSVADDGSDLQVIFGEKNKNASFPTLSPDGTRIAFVYDGDGNPEIYTMDLNGDNLRRVTDDPGIDNEPAWSPDGQWLAFNANRDGHNHIYVSRPNGQELHKLTDGNYNDTSPSWAP